MRAGLHPLLLQQAKQVVGGLERVQTVGDIRLFGQLSDLAEHRQVLIGDLERRRHDQKEVEYRLSVYCLEVGAFRQVAESKTQAAHHQRPTVGDGYPPAHAGRAQVLPSLQHAEEGTRGVCVNPEQIDQLREDLILGAPPQRQIDCGGVEIVSELHTIRGRDR
jgi:hypothetical protein